MRAPTDSIAAPPFLLELPWLNVKRLRMEQLRGRPVLIEFWDFCRPNSMRTLPYVKAWHERYGGPPPAPRRAVGARESQQECATAQEAASGPAERAREQPAREQPAREQRARELQVIGIHSPGFERGRDRGAVAAAVQRLGIEYPVLIDSSLRMWREYENLGWPARYLFGPGGMLFHYHYGEGAYEETELAIQELLDLEQPPAPLAPLRPEDAAGAVLAPQSEDRRGLYQGGYEAGGVWAVLDGTGTVEVNGGERAGGRSLSIAGPGAYPLLEHDRHTRGELSVALSGELSCISTCFTPGIH
ncbi:MAG: thioredoxin domain-containing protein [Solirubrobacteraceae bacterium]